MFLIIWGHFFPPHMSKYIYSINVPIFFFISGYLFKDSDTRILLSKIVKSLVIPYLILASINLAINMGLGVLQIDGFSRFGRTRLPRAIIGILTGCHNVQGVPGAGPLWFVYDLIIIKLIAHFISRNGVIKYAFLLLMLGAAVYISGLNEPVHAITPFHSIPIAYLFFESGRLLKYTQKPSSMNTIARASAVLCLVTIYYFSVRGNGSAYLFEGTLGKNALMFFISSLAAILICVLVFKSIPLRQNKFIYVSSIGTIVTLAIHGWLISIVNDFITCDSAMWRYAIVSMVWSLIILILCYFIIIRISS